MTKEGNWSSILSANVRGSTEPGSELPKEVVSKVFITNTVLYWPRADLGSTTSLVLLPCPVHAAEKSP